ncbi:uncharacterized protein [Nicotiana sylvestris]|uniref:uncharacterized protein n=1 Tax=Nicotiana sylvestris TaxID=4096 RepID=UPI00388C9375
MAFKIGGDGALRYQGRLCMPNVVGLREKIMNEIHQSGYFIHPDSTKMYHDVKEKYWWDNMKKSIAEFVAYELELPSELEFVHPVFHVSMLRKCIGDPSRVVPFKDVQVIEDLSYEEEVPVAILDRQVRKLRTKDVASVKVLWRNRNMEEMTWEAEEEMKSKYPYLFQKEDNADSKGTQDALEGQTAL